MTITDELFLIKENDLLGLVDKKGKLIVAPEYEEILHTVNNFTPVKKDGRWGYLDKNGYLTIPCQYFKVKSFSKNGFAPVRLTEKPGSWRIINQNNEIMPMEDDYGYYDIGEFNDKGLAAAKYYAKFHLIHESGKRVNKKLYNRLTYDYENNVFFAQETSTWQMIDENENIIFEPEVSYDEIYYASQGLYQVVKDNMMGYMDSTGKEVIPLKFPIAFAFGDNNLARVQLENEKFGFISKTGQMRIEAKFDDAGDFKFSLAPVSENGIYYFIDGKGTAVFDRIFLYASSFTENGMAQVHFNEESKGFIDYKGRLIFTFPKDWKVDDFTYKNVTTFSINGKKGLLDAQGNILCLPEFDELNLSSFSGLNPFKKNGKWGYIDDAGQICINKNFENASTFSKSGIAYASFMDNDKVIDCYINTKGLPIARYEVFDTYGNFNDSDLAPVKLKNGNYIYHKLGHEEYKTEYEYATLFYQGEGMVLPLQKSYLLSKDGEKLPFNIEDYDGNRVVVKTNYKNI